MLSARLLWLLACVTVNIESSRTAVPEEYRTCTTTSDCNCTMETDRFTWDCLANNSRLQLKLGVNQCELNCNGIAHYSLYLPQIQPMRDAKYLAFNNCPLPNRTTLANVVTRIASDQVEIVTMQFCDLSHVQRANFAGLEKINKLRINSCTLQQVPEDLLYSLRKLILLDLSRNAIEELPEGLFNETRHLQNIDLGGNRLQSIPEGLLVNIVNLTSVSLWGNNISHIASDMFVGLGNLTTLELMNNRLKTVEVDVFQHLLKLETLSLRQNLFETFPAKLFAYNTRLKKITLDGNSELKSIPDEFFANLAELKEVSLSKCGLLQLPENLFRGSGKLVMLNLAENQLTSLPRYLFNDTVELESLQLEDNQLETIEDNTFGKLNSLVRLNLEHNQLTVRRGTFLGLTKVEELYMSYNQLQALPSSSFNHFKRLKILDLSHNELTANFRDNFSWFSNLGQLQKLYLQHNNFSIIYFDWRSTLTNLEILNLRHNSITYINYNDLSFIQDPIRVDLRDNLIATIDLVGMEPLLRENLMLNKKSKNRIIDLNDNPVQCDCKLYDLLRYVDGSMDVKLRKELDLRVEGLHCTLPAEYKGISIQKVQRETLTCTLHEGSHMPGVCAQTYYKYRRHDNRVLMNCSHSGLTEVPVIDRQVLQSLKLEVNLQGNRLRTMPAPGMGYERVAQLDVSHNMINHIEWIPPNVEILKLNNNNLTSIDNGTLSLINRTLIANVTFHDNPWRCDCGLLNFTKFVRENFKKIPFLHNITCDNRGSREISTLIKSDLCPEMTGVIIISSVLFAFMGLLLGITAALYYRYQQELKVWLYAHRLCLYCISEEELDKDKLYDAFISFSHQDEDFVVNELLPKLEQGPDAFKLCVHYRNWQPGEFITTNIANSVEDSRRTVVVLSPNFLQSEWGKMEFRTAHIKALGEGRARVIVIIYGDIGPTDNLDPELKAYLTTNTYVEWGDPWFWEKLRYALPHPPKYSASRSPITSEQNRHGFEDKLDLIKEPGTPPMATTPPADAIHINPLSDNKPTANAINVALINGALVNHITARNNNSIHAYSNDVIC